MRPQYYDAAIKLQRALRARKKRMKQHDKFLINSLSSLKDKIPEIKMNNSMMKELQQYEDASSVFDKDVVNVPKKPKKRKKTKKTKKQSKWMSGSNRKRLLKAIEDVKNGKSRTEVSKKYRIPRSTLQMYLKKIS